MSLSRSAPLVDQFLNVEKETEILVIQLVIEGYLRAQVHQTQYASYAYLIPSFTAPRITLYARKDLGKCDYSVRCHFPIKVRKITKGKARSLSDDDSDPPPQGSATTSGARPPHLTKRKHGEMDDQEDDDDENVIEISSDVADEDDEILEADPPPRSRGGQKLLDSSTRGVGSGYDVIVDSDSEERYPHDLEGDDDIWMYSHRPKPRQRRRTKSPPTMADLPDF